MARIIGLLISNEKPTERQEPYICHRCGKVYKTAAALKAHVTKTHPHAFDDMEQGGMPRG